MSSKMSEYSKSKLSVAKEAEADKASYNVPTLGLLNPELTVQPV